MDFSIPLYLGEARILYICMNMNCFCTISTVSHLFKTYALADSIAGGGGMLNVLLIDGEEQDVSANPNNISFYYLADVNKGIGKELILKYKRNKDKLRWALKSVFLNYLLEKNSKVIYIDNDIYFFGEYSFLFDELNTSSMLLTPHFYKANPQEEQNWLEANYRVGLYNAGFMGVNKNARPALKWWAECCLYNLKQSYWRGLFDDQKYLDLLPIHFDKVQVLKNKGCNLAGWNYKTYTLSRDSNNEVVVENKFPLVFVHFAELSMLEFSKPNALIFNEYNKYIEALNKYNNAYKVEKNVPSEFSVFSYLYFIKWRIARMIE